MRDDRASMGLSGLHEYGGNCHRNESRRRKHPENELLERKREVQVKAVLLWDNVTKDYQKLLKSGPREFSKSLEDWNFENGLLLYQGKVYIQKSEDDNF